jgi:hypothetical protein
MRLRAPFVPLRRVGRLSVLVAADSSTLGVQAGPIDLQDHPGRRTQSVVRKEISPGIQISTNRGSSKVDLSRSCLAAATRSCAFYQHARDPNSFNARSLRHMPLSYCVLMSGVLPSGVFGDRGYCFTELLRRLWRVARREVGYLRGCGTALRSCAHPRRPDR